jgi:hypothetical protein
MGGGNLQNISNYFNVDFTDYLFFEEPMQYLLKHILVR